MNGQSACAILTIVIKVEINVKKAFIIIGACLAVLLVVSGIGLVVVTQRVKSFPDFQMVDENISVETDEIFSWIEQVVSFGHRKPATDGDEKTRAFIAAKFKEFGLECAEPEPVPVETSVVHEWSLVLRDPQTNEEMEIPSFHVPFPAPTPENGIEAPLVYIGGGHEICNQNLKGKIVVFEQPATTQNWSLYKSAFFVHDPGGSIPDDYRPSMLDADHERLVHDLAVDGGAQGFVGLLTNLQWESETYCPQLNLGVSKKIPGYWISPGNSKTVMKWLKRDDVTGRMIMSAEQGRSETYNLWATLPGEIDEYYIVMGHHDAPYDNAVQDFAGVSVMLALAKHFSGIAEERPLKRGVIFLAIGAHTLGRLGESAFVERHRDDLLPKVALVVAIEHIGKEFIPQKDLSFICSDQPSPRLIVISQNKNIGGIVKSSILHNDYRRSAIIPQWIVKATTGKSRGISGEFYDAGAPVVGLLPSPPYLFFQEDTLDTVARDQLVPTAALVASMLRAADELPLDKLR